MALLSQSLMQVPSWYLFVGSICNRTEDISRFYIFVRVEIQENLTLFLSPNFIDNSILNCTASLLLCSRGLPEGTN